MKRYEQMMMPLDLLGIFSMRSMIVACNSMILLLVYSEDK